MTASATGLRLFVDKLSSHSPLGDEEQEALLGLPGAPLQALASFEVAPLSRKADHGCLVVEGLVGRFGQTREGGRQITALHVPGDLADLQGLVMPAAPTGLQTLVPSTILRIPHVALRQVARAHPRIAEALWRECALEAAILAQQVINIGRRASRARVAHLLCELACRYGAAEKQPALVFRFAMTQTHLADVLGLTAVHVNRTLRRLRDEGVISVSGRVLRILDWGRLLDIGEFEAAYLLSPACSSEEGFSAVARLPAQDLRSLTDTLRASPA